MAKIHRLIDRDRVREDIRAELIAAMERVSGTYPIGSKYADGAQDGLAIAIDIVSQALKEEETSCE